MCDATRAVAGRGAEEAVAQAGAELAGVEVVLAGGWCYVGVVAGEVG